jgi:hypothetical protein
MRKTFRCYNCGKRRPLPAKGDRYFEICNCMRAVIKWCCDERVKYEPEHKADQLRRTHICLAGRV